MGIVRSFPLMAALGLVTASCTFEVSTQTDTPSESAAPAPAVRPATYGEPRSIGGAMYQWSLMITVDALPPGTDDWYQDQECDHSAQESTNRQRRFADRLGVALQSILLRNSHCAIASLAPIAYGQNGCGRDHNVSNPSGVYAVFSCTNSEPLNTSRSPAPAPQP